MLSNHNPDSIFDFSEWRQVGELMEVVPFDHQRNGVQQQQPRPNNQPMMSFSSGSTNFNFWGGGPVSINIYPGENSQYNFHQATAPNSNYLQPGPIVQSPPPLFPMSNASGAEQFFTPNSGNGFPSPSFSDAMSLLSSPQSDTRQLPSTPSTVGASTSSGQTSTAISTPDVHRFSPYYSHEFYNESIAWRARLEEEEQNAPSEQSEPANSNGSAVAGASATVPNPSRQRSRHTAAPGSRPATRAYTRQQNKSV